MSIEEQITQLIDKYTHETNRNQSEADLRAGYIDLLFSALGWNTYNNPDEHTNYRRENYIRGAGFVDVGLEINSQPVLMLEAKKFGLLSTSDTRIFDRTTEEKQLFRYARGKKIPYCILTNFERLHVFNADHERLILAFDSPSEYLRRFTELLHLTPEKLEVGSLSASERQLEIKDIDKTFLSSLQEWRTLLANAIYHHNMDNPALKTKETLDFEKLMAAVQRLLDRLILIRFADDKEILLNYDVVENMLNSYRKKGGYAKPDDLSRELIDFSHRMDTHHNTTLFQPGHICEQVHVPNEVLEKIMNEMNNISFRKFTSDILGNTYESYLSTKLVLNNGEIQPENRADIRKAGGIYYTPTMVVHYIVDNTLGLLLNNLEKEFGLRAIEKAKNIRVLDPACGSGSFLIYAYQVLADFYRRFNKRLEDERTKLLESLNKTEMFQRMEVFKQLPEPLYNYPHHILENQIYGVDIDSEAAEIAAVNLTMQAFADSKLQKLPLILNENIKTGNSILGGTEEELRKCFGENWFERKPFIWQKEFPKIMSDSLFDVVIGNPPYVGERGHKELFRETRCGNLGKYYSRKMDIFYFFIHLALDLCKDNSYIGFITTNYFLTADGAELLRNDLHERSIILKLINFNELKMFESASGQHNMIITLRKGRNDDAKADTCITKRKGTSKPEIIISILDGKDDETTYYQVQQKNLYEGANLAIRISGIMPDKIKSPMLSILEKIKKQGTPLGVLCNVNMGVESGADNVGKALLSKALKNHFVTQEYLDNQGIKVGSPIYVVSEELLATFNKKERKEAIKPFVKNSEIKKYWLPTKHETYYLYLDSEMDINQYPNIRNYLMKFRPILKAREQVKDDDSNWYRIRGAKRKYLINTGEHILCPYRSKQNIFALSDGNILGAGDVYFITKKLENQDLRYILSILNSKLCYFWLYNKGKRKGEILELYQTPLSQIPVKDIKVEEQIPFINIVNTIMEITKSSDYLSNPSKQSKVSEIQNIIDTMVYDLYSLKSDERTFINEAIGQ
jgi:adenine-specific DNA-methyltransferase